jgi:hypothetical protein
MWFMVPGGEWVSDNEFHGALYEAFGTASRFAFDPRWHSVNAVGIAALKMLPDGTLDFVVDYPAAPKHVVLRRFEF